MSRLLMFLLAYLTIFAPHFSLADDDGFTKPSASFELFSGYTAYPGISDGGASLGLSLEVKNASLSDSNMYGPWEYGLIENFVLGQRFLNAADLYLGYGIADKNRLSAGAFVGAAFLNKSQNDGFFSSDYDFGGMFGVQLKYDVHLFGNFYLVPSVSASLTTLPGVPFVYSGLVGIAYITPWVFSAPTPYLH